ncbi:MAG: ATP-binding protein [Cyclonatronaceae bacterium]
MEITKTLNISEDEINLLDLHSFINIFSIITSNLQLLQLNIKNPDVLDSIIDRAITLSRAMLNRELQDFNLPAILDYQNDVVQQLEQLKTDRESNDLNLDIEDEIQTMTRIFEVMNIRAEELLNRWQHPGKWEVFRLEAFREDFHKFFYAMEKNSRGRYRIRFNIADKEEADYLIQFVANSDSNNSLCMIMMLKDVMRDLMANARKYTPPGGKIDIGVSMKQNVLRFVIEDSGIGIPQNQIEKVVEFGYRASNVKDTYKTMGGGFGLTKAYFFTKKNDGRLWIESREGLGTKISIEIPVPESVQALN